MLHVSGVAPTTAIEFLQCCVPDVAGFPGWAVSESQSRGLLLNQFDIVNVSLVVWKPYGAPLLENGPHQSRIKLNSLRVVFDHVGDTRV